MTSISYIRGKNCKQLNTLSQRSTRLSMSNFTVNARSRPPLPFSRVKKKTFRTGTAGVHELSASCPGLLFIFLPAQDAARSSGRFFLPRQTLRPLLRAALRVAREILFILSAQSASSGGQRPSSRNSILIRNSTRFSRLASLGASAPERKFCSPRLRLALASEARAS